MSRDTVSEFLLLHHGEWFSPAEIAENGGFNVMSVYSALRELTKSKPEIYECEERQEGNLRRVFYRAKEMNREAEV